MLSSLALSCPDELIWANEFAVDVDDGDVVWIVNEHEQTLLRKGNPSGGYPWAWLWSDVCFMAWYKPSKQASTHQPQSFN